MFLKYNKWALLWALLIFILCALPGRDIPHVSWLELVGMDKFIHASLFFVQVFLLIKGFNKQTNYDKMKNNPMVSAIILCIVYGGLLEIMQGAFYTDRTADIYDFIANSFGAVAGSIFYYYRM